MKLKLLQSQALDTVGTEAKDLVVHFWVLFFSPWRMFHLCNLAAQSEKKNDTNTHTHTHEHSHRHREKHRGVALATNSDQKRESGKLLVRQQLGQ